LLLICVVEQTFSEWRWGGGRGSSWRTALASFVQWVQWKTRLMPCYTAQPIIERDIGCMLTSEIGQTMTLAWCGKTRTGSIRCYLEWAGLGRSKEKTFSRSWRTM